MVKVEIEGVSVKVGPPPKYRQKCDTICGDCGVVFETEKERKPHQIRRLVEAGWFVGNEGIRCEGCRLGFPGKEGVV